MRLTERKCWARILETRATWMKEIGVSKKIFENSCFNEHVGKKGLAITVKVYPFNRKREKERSLVDSFINDHRRYLAG